MGMTCENIRQLYAEHGSVELTRATFAGPADQLSADFCQTFAVHPNASIGVQVTIGRFWYWSPFQNFRMSAMFCKNHPIISIIFYDDMYEQWPKIFPPDTLATPGFWMFLGRATPLPWNVMILAGLGVGITQISDKHGDMHKNQNKKNMQRDTHTHMMQFWHMCRFDEGLYNTW